MHRGILSVKKRAVSPSRVGRLHRLKKGHGGHRRTGMIGDFISELSGQL